MPSSWVMSSAGSAESHFKDRRKKYIKQHTQMHKGSIFFKVMCSHHDTLLESVDIETNSKIHVLVALIHIYCRFSQTGLVFNCREGICYFMDITDLIMNGTSTTPDFNDGYSFKLPFNLHKQIKCTYLK